jgi:hypothetical protein
MTYWAIASLPGRSSVVFYRVASEEKLKIEGGELNLGLFERKEDDDV